MKKNYATLCFILCLVIWSGQAIANQAAETTQSKEEKAVEQEQILENRAVTLLSILDEPEIKSPQGGKTSVGPFIAGSQNSKGDVYLVRNTPARILVFTKEGGLAFQFGEEGDKPGQFRKLFGIAIDKQDMVYICDVQRGKILVFTPLGDFLEEFPSNSALVKADKFQGVTPGCLAIQPKTNDIFVSDPANGHIWVYEINGKFKRYFKGEQAGLFCTPGFVRFDASQRIYVPEGMCDRVRVFDQEGTELYKIGGQNQNLGGNFSRLTGIAVTSDGRIYATDYLMKCIQVFSPEGKFQGVIKWLENGDEKIKFHKLTGIFIGHDDSIFIIEQKKNKVYRIKDQH